MRQPSRCLLIAMALLSQPLLAADDTAKLVSDLKPLLACLTGQRDSYSLLARIEVPIGGQTQQIDGRITQFDSQSLDVEFTHRDYAISVRRRADSTALALPKHQTVFLGRGPADATDHLAPPAFLSRLISPASQASLALTVLKSKQPADIVVLFASLVKLKYEAASDSWRVGDLSLRFEKEGQRIHLQAGDVRVRLELADLPDALPVDKWPEFKTVSLPRDEIERQLVRGLRRASEIALPGSELTSPRQNDRKVEHGELRWIGGQRVVLLHGSPEQIGTAHGKLLKAEAERCFDSVLYTFGLVQAVRTGRWFRHDLETAYARLSPHIPDAHKQETRATAAALGIDEQLAQTLNVFPELFHCSGFAVYGRATKDGKLYHGRVLDYMTTIGLQDAATTFIVAVDGKIPFANVGYAGFTGSVSGMNARAISLGEMGGRGEGKWDGVPMATLMRRALEECETLDEVMDLWKKSPRTCEYYYVFADGKTNRAVGVSAVPESVEFVAAGESHPRLGEGIADTVVLSAGSRLEKLRERVKERFGRIDAEAAQWLMSRPVAMESNLHNVLFVPADGVLFVANADHRRPAAERPYVRLDLRELLREMNGATK